MAESPPRRLGQADRGDRRQARSSRAGAGRRTPTSATLDAAPPSARTSARRRRGTGRGGATARPAGRGRSASSDGHSASGQLPRQVEQPARRSSRSRSRGSATADSAGAARPSELLAQVGRHRRVVAERLVQVARLGTMVAGGQLDERRAERRRRSARPRRSGSGRRRARGRRHRRRARGSGRSSRRARSAAWRGRR